MSKPNTELISWSGRSHVGATFSLQHFGSAVGGITLDRANITKIKTYCSEREQLLEYASVRKF